MTRRFVAAFISAALRTQPDARVPNRVSSLLRAVLVCLLGVAGSRPALGHDLVQEQVVRISMRSTSGVLAVHLQIPVDALPSAALPRTPDGALDSAALAESVRIVAVDAVRNLDVLEGGAAIPQTAFAAQLASDAASIGVDVTYATRGTTGFSARLGTFAGTPQRPVRTTVDFVTLEGQHVPVSVVGPSTRVTFDPPTSDVVALSLRQTVQRLLGFGDAVLLLLCVLAPMRSGREAGSLIALVVVAQVLGLLMGLAVSWPTGFAANAAALMAASAVVVAALQVIGSARPAFVMVVGAVFGLAFGLTLVPGIIAGEQLAGAHRAAAVSTTVVTLVLMQFWIGAVLWVSRAWLDAKGVPAYGYAALMAVIIGHSALHHVMNAAPSTSVSATFFSGHMTAIVTLIWLALAIGVALADSGRTTTAARREPSLSQ